MSEHSVELEGNTNRWGLIISVIIFADGLAGFLWGAAPILASYYESGAHEPTLQVLAYLFAQGSSFGYLFYVALTGLLMIVVGLGSLAYYAWKIFHSFTRVL